MPLHELHDPPVCETLAARPGFAGRARALPPVSSPSLLAAVLGEAELVVAMRLHAGILAARAGTPVVVLDYDPKTRAFAEQTGQSRWAVPVDELETATPESVEKLVWAITDTLSDLPARRAALARAVMPLRAEAGRTAGLAVQLARQRGSPRLIQAPRGPMGGDQRRGPGRSVRSVVGKAALIILAATLVGRALGLVRDIAVAYFFGAQADTDAFFLAYKVPYLLTLMVSGALTATFVPLFSYRLATGRKAEAWDLSVNIGNIIAVILVGLSVVLVVVAPWFIPLIGPGLAPATVDKGVFLFRILMIGFLFEGLTGLLVGMLNSLRRFALAAFAPAAGTVVVLVIMVAFARPLGITALAIGSVAGWVAGLAGALSRAQAGADPLPASHRLARPRSARGGEHGVADPHRLGGRQGQRLHHPTPGITAGARVDLESQLRR